MTHPQPTRRVRKVPWISKCLLDLGTCTSAEPCSSELPCTLASLFPDKPGPQIDVQLWGSMHAMTSSLHAKQQTHHAVGPLERSPTPAPL